MKAAILALAALTAAGCSMKASHALMTSGLVVATGGAVAPGEYRELRPGSVSVGLAVFAIGWVLQQSDGPSGGLKPSQQIDTALETDDEKLGIYRTLPTDHAVFTP